MELLKKIKALLGPEKFEEIKKAVSEQFGEGQLVDGTLVKWEGELAVGTALIVVTEEGEMPAPDGDHELAETGMILTTEAGIIVEIKEPAEAPSVEEEMAKTVIALAERVEKLEKALNASQESMKAQKKINVEVFNLIEKIAAEPTAEPVEPKKNQFSKKEMKENNLKKLAESLKNLKK